MAIKPKIKTGTGVFAVPAPLKINDEGIVDVNSLIAMNQLLTSLIFHINSGLSLGDGVNGAQAGNIDGQTMTFVTPSIAHRQFEIPHGLGRTPIGIIEVSIDRDGNVYADEYGGWNETRILLKCSAANASYIGILV